MLWPNWMFPDLTTSTPSTAPNHPVLSRAVWVVLLLAGCGAPKPDFLGVIQRNCEQGSAEACEMLASVSPAANEDTAIAAPVHSRDIVQAILAGMRRARQDYAGHDPRAPAPSVEDPNED